MISQLFSRCKHLYNTEFDFTLNRISAEIKTNLFVCVNKTVQKHKMFPG